MTVAVLDRAEDLAAIRAEWDALVGQVPGFSTALTYEYAIAGWAVASRSPTDRLAVIAVREKGELACLWPLFVRLQGGLTIARHLGFGGCEEYAGPLVRDAADPAVVRAALDAAKALADVLQIYNVPSGGLAARVLAAAPGFKQTSFVLSPVVSLQGVPDRETWLRGASKKLRAMLRHDRRRLAERGDLRFREMAGSADGLACIDWFFAQKRGWLVERRLRRSWMLADEGKDFFAALVGEPSDPRRPARVRAYALTLGDQIIAACVCFQSGDRLEFYNTTYDPAFSDWSPGNLMIEDCVAMAIDLGLDFDFRITQQAYKQRWADRSDRYDTLMFAGSARGVVAVAMIGLKARMRRLRVWAGPQVKGWLKRARGSVPN